MEGIFILFVIISIVIFLVSVVADRDRIAEYIESRGGQLLDKEWRPFGPGWFGEEDSRIYEITYLDRDGNRHKAHCKTSFWSGVYFTEDEIVSYANPRESGSSMNVESMEDELRRLREENARLRERMERGD